MNPTLLQRPVTPLLVGLHQGAGKPPLSAMHPAVHAARYKVAHALTLHLRYRGLSKDQSLCVLEPIRGLAPSEDNPGKRLARGAASVSLPAAPSQMLCTTGYLCT